MARAGRSRSKKDTSDTATTQVDDRTTAVDHAAAATRAADAPETASSVTDFVAAGTEIGTTQEPDAELAGQDLELSEEQRAEVAPPPEEDEGLPGVPSIEDLKNRKPDEDLLGTDGDPDAPSDDPRENLDAAQAFDPFGTKGDGAGTTAGEGDSGTDDTSPGTGGIGGDARDTGVFDLLQDPGAGGDPLSSFLGAVEDRLGRDLGPAPSEQTNASPAHGLISASAAPSGSTYYYNEHGAKVTTYDDGTRSVDRLDGTISATTWTDGAREVATANGSVFVSPDGSTVTKDKDGNVVDSTPPLTQPDPEHEGAPLPEIFQDQLESEVARLRALHGDSGDGVTDPTDSPVEVIDPSATLQTHAEQGHELLGQPDPTAQEDGGPANLNPGADAQGAGVITPSDDKDVVPGGTRNDDPFDGAGTAVEPVTSSNDAGVDSQSFLPSETDGPAIDDTADVPDPVRDPA